MRVYLPTTLTALARAHADGRFEAHPGVGAHAVTPALREWFAEADDVEELEYAALLDAAESSLAVLAQDGAAPRRRVVLAAEVDDALVHPQAREVASAVRLSGPVPLADVVSVHVDELDAQQAVAAAVEALPAARAGDEDARFTVDGADGHDLLWYDVTEIPDLVAP
ncbi:DUF6912 family protein [Thalassiella azotivora]